MLPRPRRSNNAMHFKYFKKVIPAVLLLAVCLSLLPVQVPVAHALDASITAGSEFYPGGTVANPDGTLKSSISGASIGDPTPKNDIGCGITSGLNFSICITNVIYVFTVGLGSAFAYVAAFFFDMAIQLSLQSTAYALDFLNTGWTLARDIANMAFIFILLYIAIKVMLNANDRTTASMLVGVVLVALLVNFSFFFTRVVIDAGNLLSVQFYNAIPSGGATIGTTAANSSFGIGGNNSTLVSQLTSVASGGQMKDLTASIMGMMKLQNLFETSAFQSWAKGQTFLTGLITLSFLYIAAGVLFWGLIVMFITVGIKFLMRIIVLWFLLIVSPLAFIAKAIPNNKFNSKFDDWLSALVNHAFYPVGFMFVFFILTIFSNQLGSNSAGDGNLINGIFSGLNDPQGADFVQGIGVAIANTAIRLGFVLGVMYIGLKASEYISVMGGTFAKSAASWSTGKFVAAPASVLGFAGRQTMGRMMTGLAKSPTIAAGAQRKDFVGALWRKTERTTKGLASATYDIRNTPGAGLVRQVIEKSTGVAPATGTAPTKGYAEQSKEAGKKREDERKERAAIIRDAANKKAIEAIASDMRTSGTAASTDEDRVRNFNKREIEVLKASEIESIAHLLNESQLKTVTDSDKYTDAEKDAVKKIAEPIIKSQKEISDTLRKASSALRTSATPVVRNKIARGSQILPVDITAMQADVNTQKAALRAEILAAAPGTNQGEKEADLTQLHNMTNSLNELARQVAKIQPIGARAGGAHHVT